MVSGKYSALSGAVAREQAMDNLASNLANVTTAGFKKNRASFSAILRGANQTAEARGINYTKIRKITTDFSQGGMLATGRALDIAIEGEGFFKVRKNDEIFYTRSGHLVIDQNGMIKTDEGLSVLGAANDPLQVNVAEGKDIVIGENGDISVNGELSGGKIQIFAIDDQEKLIKTGSSLYKLEEGGVEQPLATSRVIQGNLETSNVNMMEEMAAMIAIQRTFEAHNKVIESYSKLGEKQDELGSV